MSFKKKTVRLAHLYNSQYSSSAYILNVLHFGARELGPPRLVDLEYERSTLAQTLDIDVLPLFFLKN
jgi:hypothetical protein